MCVSYIYIPHLASGISYSFHLRAFNHYQYTFVTGNLELYLRVSSKLKLGAVAEVNSSSPTSRSNVSEMDLSGQVKQGEHTFCLAPELLACVPS